MEKPDGNNTEDFSEMEELLNETPKETTLFVSHSLSIPEYVLIKLGDRPRNYIAQQLGVTEPQVSKWLSGASNMTLRTISKLETALNIQIINPEIIQTVKENYNVSEKTIYGNMKVVRDGIKKQNSSKVVYMMEVGNTYESTLPVLEVFE